MKEKFREVKLSKANKERLAIINKIIEEFRADGYVLTLRQLYYQLVSKDIIPNNQKEYAKLSRLLKEGRLGGIVDWSAIEDRLRQVRKVATWDSPKQILSAALNQFRLDRLQKQKKHVEVWVEKDALSQVVERAANPFQVPVLVNRGYGSISAIYDTYCRVKDAMVDEDKDVTILYLGDHDPSGLDMSRDINKRLKELLSKEGLEDRFHIDHIALTMAQIQEFNPPPNPAKVQDPRAKWYIENFGDTSWEVDALPPAELNRIIQEEIGKYIDMEMYKQWEELEGVQREKIELFIEDFK